MGSAGGFFAAPLTSREQLVGSCTIQTSVRAAGRAWLMGGATGWGVTPSPLGRGAGGSCSSCLQISPKSALAGRGGMVSTRGGRVPSRGPRDADGELEGGGEGGEPTAKTCPLVGVTRSPRHPQRGGLHRAGEILPPSQPGRGARRAACWPHCWPDTRPPPGGCADPAHPRRTAGSRPPLAFAAVSSATWCPRLRVRAPSVSCGSGLGGTGGSFPCASWTDWDQTGGGSWQG